MSDEAAGDAPEGPDALGELERMVERASLFTHASFDRIAARATGLQSELHGLIDLLRSKGVLTEDDLPEPDAAPFGAQLADATPEGTGVPWPTIALRQEGPQPPPAVEVNCAERMHVCHAVCCKLHFALTAAEVDAGKVRFDVGFPYMIRHDADGKCTHNDRATGNCGVYADRPGICRHYSCAGDERIWKDFDKMELNHEWLDANLGDAQRIRLRVDLPLMVSDTQGDADT